MSDQVSGGLPSGKRYVIQDSLMDIPEAPWRIHSGL
jgi:hypothetical protein